MLARFAEWFGTECTWVWRRDALDLELLTERLRQAEASGDPVAVLGTSFAFVHAEDGLGEQRFELPPGSRVMQTGGYKGRSREVDPDILLAAIGARYGVAAPRIINEFGATELSSQMYETTLREELDGPLGPRRLWVPPWVRATPVDPDTLQPVEGETIGILRIDDTANLDSVCCIQTADLAPASPRRHRRARSGTRRNSPGLFACRRPGLGGAVTDDASVVRARAASVLEAGALLSSSTIEERAHWLAEAATILTRHAHEGRDALSEATGLSIPMIEWATRTTLDTMTEDAMLALTQDVRKAIDRAPDPIAMLSVILAGNVFTASVRGIVVPLLFGVPVLVKASSKETMFPAMLRDALRSADSRLGAAMSLVAFPGGDIEPEAALVESAEAVSVYGSDETVSAMAARIGDIPLVAHGHGVSVAYCGAAALDDAHIESTIEHLSLDICAYDQRGCLSPQLVYVDDTPHRPATDFAERLAERGLGPMSRTLPRGPLPVSVGAAQAQWRGIAEVEGALLHIELQ